MLCNMQQPADGEDTSGKRSIHFCSVNQFLFDEEKGPMYRVEKIGYLLLKKEDTLEKTQMWQVKDIWYLLKKGRKESLPRSELQG